jgi:hypothetical protein
LGDELFEAKGVGEAAVEAGLILAGGAALHVEELEGGLYDGDGGFELMGGVADEGLLLEEGALKALEDALDGVGEGGELRGVAS